MTRTYWAIEVDDPSPFIVGINPDLFHRPELYATREECRREIRESPNLRQFRRHPVKVRIVRKRGKVSKVRP